MQFGTLPGTIFLSAVVVVLLGLSIIGIAGTPAAFLIGVRRDAQWWFRRAGARSEGLVLAYLGGVVGIGSLAAMAVGMVSPDAAVLRLLAGLLFHRLQKW